MANLSAAIPATLNAAQRGTSSAAAAKEMENLSVEQLQKMVELEEKTKVKVDSVTQNIGTSIINHIKYFFQAGYFEGMTELEKYKMYKKAQMMLAIKKLKAEEKAVEEMVAEEEVGFLEIKLT